MRGALCHRRASPSRANPLRLWLSLLAVIVAACTDGTSSRDPRANAQEITALPEDAAFYLHDHHGSPVATLDSKGASIEERGYHAYGAEREPTSAHEPWAFAGNELDATDLGDFHARPYDARLGRFLAVDPEPLFNPSAQLNPIAFQAYSYAAGDPVNLEDPTGRSVWTKLFKFGVRLVKTGDAAQPLYGMFDDAATLFDGSASVTERVVAGVSLASELAPVSIGDVKDAGKALGALASSRQTAKKTEIVQRAMSRAELAATETTGLLRGGREGLHYASDAVNSTATRAQSRLALPVRPEVRATLEVPSGRFSSPSRVQPYDLEDGKVLPGGGMERTASGQVPATILKVDEL